MKQIFKKLVQNKIVIESLILIVFLIFFIDYFVFALTPDKVHGIKVALISVKDLLNLIMGRTAL
ncbi:MAG: hypothetical protein ABI721_04885 [Candidatus Dojkabacteria bacterium]